MSTIIKNSEPTRTKNQNLRFLDNLDDYKVHHDDIDPRGYDVKLMDGTVIGEVEGLLADVPAKKVRYVEVEIEEEMVKADTRGIYTDKDLYVLFPVGVVRIDANTNSIFVEGLGRDHIVNYPRYDRELGYTTAYEIDTNDYLADYHTFGSTYNRNRYSTDTFRSGDRLDDDFYNSRFYVG